MKFVCKVMRMVRVHLKVVLFVLLQCKVAEGTWRLSVFGYLC